MSSGLFYTDSMIEAAVPFPRCRDGLVVSRFDLEFYSFRLGVGGQASGESPTFPFVRCTGVDSFSVICVLGRLDVLPSLGALWV
jgi:hypothetical protein